MSIKSDTAWNIFGSAAPLIFALLTIPWMLKTLGTESFGLLSLMWALVGYFGIFDLGVGRALTYELSKEKNGDHFAGGILKSGLLITFVMGTLGFFLVFFILAPMAHLWFHINSVSESSVDATFKVIAIAVIPSSLTSATRGALEGLNGFKKSNLIKMMLGIVTFCAPPVFIYYHEDGLMSAAIGLTVGRFVICIYSLYGIKNYLILNTRNTIVNAKRLLNYGIWVTLSGMISPIMVYGDRFFVTSAIGAALLPLYAVPQEGMQRLLLLPAAVASALLPRLVGMNNKIELLEVYKEKLRYVAIGMAIICLTAIYIVPQILSYWISADFSDKTKLVVYCLAVGIWFNSIAQVPYCLLNAKGFPRTVAIIHLAELVIYVFIIYFLSLRYGVIGAAVAWGLRAALDALLLHFWAVRCIQDKINA